MFIAGGIACEPRTLPFRSSVRCGFLWMASGLGEQPDTDAAPHLGAFWLPALLIVATIATGLDLATTGRKQTDE